ncbi:MAG: hypothetical protein H6738_18655 [Alphaproteobacteria bacterium]|nr:hypothetical protein [Alphaproteobacteria bacterium]
MSARSWSVLVGMMAVATPAWAKEAGGHLGIALPLVTVTDPVTVIGADFVNVGVTPGITVHLNEEWAVDFEFIAFNHWGDDLGVTTFVVDPGVIRKFDGFVAGMRVATEVGAPTNLGLVPIVVKPFSINDKVAYFVEMDVPIFVRDIGDTMQPSVSLLFQTGFGF